MELMLALGYVTMCDRVSHLVVLFRDPALSIASQGEIVLQFYIPNCLSFSVSTPYTAMDSHRSVQQEALLERVSSTCVGQTRDRSGHQLLLAAAERKPRSGGLDCRALRRADTFARHLLRRTPSCRRPKKDCPLGTLASSGLWRPKQRRVWSVPNICLSVVCGSSRQDDVHTPRQRAADGIEGAATH